MSIRLKIGKCYYMKSDRVPIPYKLQAIVRGSKTYYQLYFSNKTVEVAAVGCGNTMLQSNGITIEEITVDSDEFTEALSILPTTIPKIYQTNGGEVKFMNSKGDVYDLNKEDINLVWKWRGNNDWYQPIDYNNKEADCAHEWVTTIGFSSEYTDCSKCGAKKEEV